MTGADREILYLNTMNVLCRTLGNPQKVHEKFPDLARWRDRAASAGSTLEFEMALRYEATRFHDHLSFNLSIREIFTIAVKITS